MLNLFVSGCDEVSRGDLSSVVTPDGNESWQPVPHHRIVDAVVNSLTSGGLQVVNEGHGVSHKGNRYFGMLELATDSGDFGQLVGIRNSHDQSFAAGLVGGTGVFVCDNLSFYGEVKLSRKHSRHILRDLPAFVAKATKSLADMRRTEEHRIACYQQAELDDSQVNDLIIAALDAGALPTTKIPGVLKEWREPSHEEFQPRTGWSFFNAFTEVMKGTNLVTLADRTRRLNGVLDGPFRVLDTETVAVGA